MTDKRMLAVAAAGLALVVGCSGHAAKPAAQAGAGAGAGLSAAGSQGAVSGSVQAGAGADGTAVAPTQPPSSGGSTSGGSTSATGSGTASPQPQPKATEVPLHARLAAACVTVGSTQTLTLHAEPDMRVIYDTNYPDGKDGQVHGGFDSRGRTSPAGVYTSTWTIAPGTPLGDADVELAAIGFNYHTGHQRLPFRIALTCP